MLRAFSYTGTILIEAQLTSIRDVSWLWFRNGFPSTKAGSVLDDDAAFSIETSAEELSRETDHIASDSISPGMREI